MLADTPVQVAAPAVPEFMTLLPSGMVDLRFHDGQQQAWDASTRIVAVISGSQSGKTLLGPPWLMREMQDRGPGDYLIAAPTYPLMNMKVVPALVDYFTNVFHLGEYAIADHVYRVSPLGAGKLFGKGDHPPTRIFFGHADDPDSLESCTAKAAWLDESGQKRFKIGSYEAIQRRLSIHQGRILHTTTPYYLGWLKKQVWDLWLAGDPGITCVNFRSTMNPAFPKAEYDRQKKLLPTWKFDLFYNGLFTRPAGVIYDSFDEKNHTVPRFMIPTNWPRYVGLDFGGVHTAATFYAEETVNGKKTGRYFLYRVYKAGSRTAAEHAREILRDEPRVPVCVGGSKSEGQWRREFAAAGLPIRGPDIADVEIGISRVYGMHKEARILAFDDLSPYLDEKGAYARVLDAESQPTEEIEDKADFHVMDSERYIIGWLNGAHVQREAYSYAG